MRTRDRQRLKRFAHAYRRAVAASVGVADDEVGILHWSPPERRDISKVRAQIALDRCLATFSTAVASGATIEEGVVVLARSPASRTEMHWVRALAESLRLGGQAPTYAGSLGVAVVASTMKAYELAWSNFLDVPLEVWTRLAPAEYFRVGFLVDRARVVQTVETIIADPTVGRSMPPAGWLMMIEELTLAGNAAMATSATTLAMAHAEAGRWTDDDNRVLKRLVTWCQRSTIASGGPRTPSHTVALAVLGYETPDIRRTSTNLGDHVQTLAALLHVARRSGHTFTGPPALVDFVNRLVGHVRPERRIASSQAAVELVPVDRDASSWARPPDGTWALMFGWYAHRRNDLTFDFPPNPALRPIYVSFHCSRPEMLTPDAVDHLRAHAPIGCRDWNTTYLLLGLGIDAYFSGCVTSTIGALMGVQSGAVEGPHLVIDATTTDDSEGPIVQVEQGYEQVAWSSQSENLETALDRIRHLRTARHVTTSRLHTYLPAHSMHVPVTYVPKSRGDLRLNGLLGLSVSDIDVMGERLIERLEAILTTILAGRSNDEVYAAWRNICADDVAAARTRLSMQPRIESSFDVAPVSTLTRTTAVQPRPTGAAMPAHAVRASDGIEVAIAVDANLATQAEVLVESLLATSRRPLNLWVLSRGFGPDDHTRFATLFPSVSVHWLSFDSVDYGPVSAMLKHTTISTMDRLVLPDVVPVERVVYLDVDLLARADVGELFDWDLRGNPIAAATPISIGPIDGYRTNVLARLADLDELGTDELLRHVCHTTPYGFTSFNAGVLVLDLQMMRSTGFVESVLPLVERFGMNDQQALNLYAAWRREPLPPTWNHIPHLRAADDPKLVHWAGPLKPWGDALLPWAIEWREHRARVDARLTQR